ncbi:MAG: hypothetical protein A2007_01285 [Verrucomicrobia bacterium GWC2_42_7]|nr:MAG: hypothetical protein A2007_01285 [Verrucomicrobia bacterium GWC2_42_7]
MKIQNPDLRQIDDLTSSNSRSSVIYSSDCQSVERMNILKYFFGRLLNKITFNHCGLSKNQLLTLIERRSTLHSLPKTGKPLTCRKVHQLISHVDHLIQAQAALNGFELSPKDGSLVKRVLGNTELNNPRLIEFCKKFHIIGKQDNEIAGALREFDRHLREKKALALHKENYDSIMGKKATPGLLNHIEEDTEAYVRESRLQEQSENPGNYLHGEFLKDMYRACREDFYRFDGLEISDTATPGMSDQQKAELIKNKLIEWGLSPKQGHVLSSMMNQTISFEPLKPFAPAGIGFEASKRTLTFNLQKQPDGNIAIEVNLLGRLFFNTNEEYETAKSDSQLATAEAEKARETNAPDLEEKGKMAAQMQAKLDAVLNRLESQMKITFHPQTLADTNPAAGPVFTFESMALNHDIPLDKIPKTPAF